MIELIAPNLLLLSSLSFYIVQGATTGSVCGLALGIVLWIAALVIQRALPVEKPTELAKRVQELSKKLEELDATVLANAQYTAKELGTLNTVLKINQMR